MTDPDAAVLAHVEHCIWDVSVTDCGLEHPTGCYTDYARNRGGFLLQRSTQLSADAARQTVEKHARHSVSTVTHRRLASTDHAAECPSKSHIVD